MATTLRVEIDADAIATITFDAPGVSVNTMSKAWRADWADAVEYIASARGRIRGVVLASAKPGFMSGADLAEALAADDAVAAFHDAEALNRSIRCLETLGVPVVALLAGAALDGGWALALAAHARFAVDDTELRFGMPGVGYGLLPGAAGITKTVRRLGLVAALPYLVEGRLFAPREALAQGLVDGLAPHAGELRAAALAWIDAHPDAVWPWDRKGYRMPGGSPSDPALAATLAVAPAALARRTGGLYPAPQAILEAMVEGALVDYDTATRIESRKFARVVVGSTAKNLIGAFDVDLRAIRAGGARPGGVARGLPARVGLVGAGGRVAELAQALTAHGIVCVLHDPKAQPLPLGIDAFRARAGDEIQAERIEAANEAMRKARIATTQSLDDLRGCDLIITFNFDDDADETARAHAFDPAATASSAADLAGCGARGADDTEDLATPSSTLKIEALADACAHPERVVGIRLSPVVNGLRLAAIVRGARTDDTAIARAFDLALPLGWVPISGSDGARGSFTRRLVLAFTTECAAMLAEGIASSRVEHAALAAGMRQGSLGADVAHRLERAGAAPPPDELAQRLLYRQAIEAARCLADGAIASAAEANLASILGAGFPAWTGGAIRFIASEGGERFVANAEALAARHGDGFALSADARAAVGRSIR